MFVRVTLLELPFVPNTDFFNHVNQVALDKNHFRGSSKLLWRQKLQEYHILFLHLWKTIHVVHPTEITTYRMYDNVYTHQQ